jgi:hypothetical protein
MEPVEPNRSEGRQAERSEPEPLFLWRAIEKEMVSNADFQALQQAAGQFARSEGKFLPAFGSALIENSAGKFLFLEYLRRAGALRIDEAVLCALCEE